jgi:hypothetical protein
MNVAANTVLPRAWLDEFGDPAICLKPYPCRLCPEKCQRVLLGKYRLGTPGDDQADLGDSTKVQHEIVPRA